MGRSPYLATSNGLLVAQRGADGWAVIGHALSGHRLTSVAAWEGAIAVGRREGVAGSLDDGETWQQINDGLAVHNVRWLPNRQGSHNS